MEWLEVSVSDVIRELCQAASGKSAPGTAKRSTKSKSRPERERAKWALKQLYPNDNVPQQLVLPNWQLCHRVNETLKQHQMPTVSKDTILRAAGRRK
jgi:tartrate dehydratase alpha subunit/fumarate hydratase class I-like protein